MISVQGLTKRFGEVVACQDVTLEVARGEIVTLLGPSGCGKTTTLRCISGSVRPDAGRVWIKGREVTDRPTHERNIGLVFQNFALFPHMSAFGNVAFPLKVRGVPKPERRERVTRALDLVRLTGLGDRYPRELSGGQQQRVGLARALVYEPPVVLFDEPLSNLDAKLRLEMRYEILKVQEAMGFAAIYVTHDQEEALSLSHRIAVMEGGVIHQVGTPQEIYDRPQTPFVAEFLGNPNRLTGRCVAKRDSEVRVAVGEIMLIARDVAREVSSGDDAVVFVRPEDISVGRGDASSTYQVEGRIVATAFLGNAKECLVSLGDELEWRVRLHPSQRVESGEAVTLSLPIDRCLAFRMAGQRHSPHQAESANNG